MPLILGAQSAVATGFSVDNSCRFDDGDAVQLYRAVSVAGNRKVWTISFWIKKGNAVGCRLFAQGATPSQDPSTMFELGASGAMTIFDYRSSTYNFILEPLAKLTDRNAWYHICMTFDSTPATPSSTSIKFFINGTQQTQFSTETYPSQDFETEINNTTYDFYAAAYDGGNYYDGYMAEFCLIDGTAYDADSFGQFNEDSPNIWEPIDVSGLTFGTNGFHLDFGDSSALGTDAAGSNNLTATNLVATDQCVDSPTNNFAVVNSLDNYYPGVTFSEGNTQVVTPASSIYAYTTCSVGLTAGKWYWEFKPTTMSLDEQLSGITSTQCTSATAQILGYFENDWAYYANNGYSYNNNSGTSYGDSYAVNDIIGVALDITNSKLYFAKNGVWQNSGVPTSGATGTGALSITAVASTPLGAYFPAQTYWQSASNTFGVNYGNPPYANSSDAADGNGYGKFEYAPPSGYLAICTKNLGSDGG